jgi:hypothetical protein
MAYRKQSGDSETIVHPTSDDYIIRKEKIDTQFWELKIRNLCRKIGTKLESQKVEIDNVQNDNGSNCLVYLKNVTRDIPELRNEIVSELGEFCEFRHELIGRDSPYNSTPTSKFFSWIVITKEAEACRKSSLLSFASIKARTSKADFYKFLVCILGFTISVYLLANHWSGYEKPWIGLIDSLSRMFRE